MQDVGAPDWVIGQALGHASSGVTQRHYLPPRSDVVQQWIDKLTVRG